MDPYKLVNVHRGENLESTHYGHIAVVDSSGKLIASLGNPTKEIYARSAMKPLQAIPLVETGAADYYEYSDADLSLSCASHSSEKQHTDRVTAILNRAGIPDNHLQCGTHIPHSKDTYKELLQNGKDLTPLYSNCSGKHTGMLVTAKYKNESLEDYYQLDHPVQQRILSAISELSETPAEKIKMGVDGCGVPVHYLPLHKMAYVYARMANPSNFSTPREDALNRITTAMTVAPEMVGGTGRFCTDFMKTASGKLFGKAGAEGVYCIGDKESGIGIVIKIEDGNGRAMYPVAVEVLKQLNLLSDQHIQKLKHHHYPVINNARNEKVGQITPSFQL